MVECETVSFSSKNAQKDLEIIYFRKNRLFLSGFGKLNCFGYIACSICSGFTMKRWKRLVFLKDESKCD